MPAITRPVRIPLKAHILVTDSRGNDIIIKRTDIRKVEAYRTAKGQELTTIYFYNRLVQSIDLPVSVRHFYNHVLYPTK